MGGALMDSVGPKKAAKNKPSASRPFAGTVVSGAGIEDSAATNTDLNNFWEYRAGRADGAQGTTGEFIRSAGVSGLRAVTGIANLAAEGLDFGARQVGISGNYASSGVSGLQDLAFGSNPRDEYGSYVGTALGIVGSLAGAAGKLGSIRSAGKAALPTGQRGASVARQAVSSSIGAAKSRGSKIIRGAKNLSQKEIPNPLRYISPKPSYQNLREMASSRRFSRRLQAGKYRPTGAAFNQNFKFNPISYPTSVPKNTSSVSAGRKVGTANSYINQNLTEKGLSYRGISPYSPEGTAMRRQYLYPNRASTAAGSKGFETTVPNYIPAQWRASGGLIDSVPAMLTPGEYVMSSSSVQKHGTSFMNKLNRGGKVKGFATGGAVGAMSVGASSNNNDMSGNISALSEAFQQGASIIATAFNFEALNNIAGVFASFTESMTNISESLNGMTMTHQVTVDGQLNIAGLNIATIADAVKQEVSNLVANEVSRITGNDAKKMNPNG
jgi:hypothetical protein